MIFNYTLNLGKFNIFHSYFGGIVETLVRGFQKNSLVEKGLFSALNKIVLVKKYEILLTITFLIAENITFITVTLDV